MCFIGYSLRCTSCCFAVEICPRTQYRNQAFSVQFDSGSSTCTAERAAQVIGASLARSFPFLVDSNCDEAKTDSLAQFLEDAIGIAVRKFRSYSCPPHLIGNL